MKYLIICERSMIFYLLIVTLYKMMGKREIGELSIIDFIVSLFIAELVAISIENYEQSILNSILPILILVILQILSSLISLKSKKVRDLLDGSPSIIISNGKLNLKEMKRLRYNMDDLLSQLRGEKISCIEEVAYAILETNGKLSIFPKKEHPPFPLPIILNGKIEEQFLKEIHKSKGWIEQEVKKKNLEVKDIFYGFYKKKHLYLIPSKKK